VQVTVSVAKKKHDARNREKFFIAQQGKCWLCGQPMRWDVHPNHALAPTWDHGSVSPKAAGALRTI
jgi:hypothetical protein